VAGGWIGWWKKGALRRRNYLARCAGVLFVGWGEPWRNPCGGGDGYRFAQRHPTTAREQGPFVPPGRPAWPVNPIADRVRSYARASCNRRSNCLAGRARVLFVGWVEPWRNPCGGGDGYRFAQRHPTTDREQGPFVPPGRPAWPGIQSRTESAPARASNCLAGCAGVLFVGWVEPWRNPCGGGDGYRFAQRHPTTDREQGPFAPLGRPAWLGIQSRTESAPTGRVMPVGTRRCRAGRSSRWGSSPGTAGGRPRRSRTAALRGFRW